LHLPFVTILFTSILTENNRECFNVNHMCYCSGDRRGWLCFMFCIIICIKFMDTIFLRCSSLWWRLQRLEWHHLFTRLPFQLSKICLLYIQNNSIVWERVCWIHRILDWPIWLCVDIWRSYIPKMDRKVC